ncbi:unnamed protein product, partial [marine sediment metagenome]
LLPSALAGLLGNLLGSNLLAGWPGGGQFSVITWERMRNTKNGAMADFMRMFMDKLPESCILRASFKEMK